METGQDMVADPAVQPVGVAADTAALPRARWSFLAGASGYLALVPFLAAFYLFPYAYAGFPSWFSGKWIAITAAITVGCAAPGLILGILGHLRIRRNPSLQGIGHVRFAYVSCAMALGVIATALVMHPFRR
jgi:hypothetical protein